MEYYAGILFLTTNRIGDFDEAFGSRIHISLHYPQLKLQPTLEIFELNLRLIKQRFKNKNRNLNIEEVQILDSAKRYWLQHKKMRWNGRQIRNACQTALALAEFDAQGGSHSRILDPNAVVELKVHHLEVVSAAYLEFTRYLKRLYKTDQDRLAQRTGMRARELRENSEELYGLGSLSSDDETIRSPFMALAKDAGEPTQAAVGNTSSSHASGTGVSGAHEQQATPQTVVQAPTAATMGGRLHVPSCGGASGLLSTRRYGRSGGVRAASDCPSVAEYESWMGAGNSAGSVAIGG